MAVCPHHRPNPRFRFFLFLFYLLSDDWWSNSCTYDEEYAVAHAKKIGLCKVGDRVVGVHDVDDCAVMKILDVE